MLVCWSVSGGVGTSVVAAGLALAAARHEGAALVVDLAGDQPALFGAPDPAGPGIAEWLRASPDVGVEALARLEVAVADEVALLPRGSGPLEGGRVRALLDGLAAEDRFVVVDAGVANSGSVGAAMVEAAAQTLLVTRACPVALRRLRTLPVVPSGVVVVRERRRAVTWHDVAEAAASPVVAELEVDPAVAAAVDAGLARRSLPRSFLRVLDGLR